MTTARKSIDFGRWVIYDETSPTCLRWNVDVFTGQYYKTFIAKKGDVAGSVVKDQIKTVCIEGVSYYCSRVVYELFYGSIPQGLVVDHQDGDRLNNKIDNLRTVTQLVNMHNQSKRSTNTSGVTGVSRFMNSCSNQYWRAQWIVADSKIKSKYFSISNLGDEEAFRLACEYRARMIAELNAQGAGYTDRHGKCNK